MKWASAICTAPRSENLLEQTFKSIQNAGWNPKIYAEPNTITTLPIIQRDKVYGAWLNWLFILFEMYQTTDAEYFIVFEDDIKICKNTREYIENSIPLLGEFGYISLYTPSHLRRNNERIFHNEALGLWTYGTQAIVFSRDKLKLFLLNERVFTHRENEIYFFGIKKEKAGNDLLLGMWADEVNLPIFYHSPSLVQHCGFETTQDSKDIHQAADFLGEDFDALTLNTIQCVVLKNRDILHL